MVTRIRYVNLVQFVCFTSSFEPKNVKEVLSDESWIKAMQEELEKFTRNEEFVKQMTDEFEMSMVGELNYFLGLQVKQSEDGTFISQSKYAKNLIKKFGMESAKHANIPMGTTVKLTKEENGVKVDPTLYRSMTGSLMYLTASRLDISYSVGVCARYQGNPMESHVTAVKRIIRYVNDTQEYGIWYSNETNSNLFCFSVADWAGNTDDRKSTSGGCFYMGNNLVSWHSKKQNSISLSTVEAEYIAAGSCCTQLLWMKQMMTDYGFCYPRFFQDVRIHTLSLWAAFRRVKAQIRPSGQRESKYWQSKSR
ncbi:uncharacterized mitochondrial protein AtMg00810-like [Humulus lupulus]|uniref:uncharacterized mitochondrial protein AtMg00810-like n=1 Tax=Humulus lupulus TaxID=3486 RepID=UPI002B41570B|nr:uncharacterized mitochondrial protein AtMg00810-like [Humulus lupulus]